MCHVSVFGRMIFVYKPLGVGRESSCCDHNRALFNSFVLVQEFSGLQTFPPVFKDHLTFTIQNPLSNRTNPSTYIPSSFSLQPSLDVEKMCIYFIAKAIKGRKGGDRSNDYDNTRVVPTSDRPISPRSGVPQQNGQVQGQQQHGAQGGGYKGT